MKIISNKNQKEIVDRLERIEKLAENIYSARYSMKCDQMFSEDNIVANSLEILYDSKDLIKELK